jgi:hypothetical protein
MFLEYVPFPSAVSDCTAPHCIVLHYTTLCCAVFVLHFSVLLRCTALYCTVLYCTALYCAVLHCIELYCTVLCCTALNCTALHRTVVHCTVLYCIEVHCTVLYCICMYCTALYCTNSLFSFQSEYRWTMLSLCRELKEGLARSGFISAMSADG